jgi:hypothetical protein
MKKTYLSLVLICISVCAFSQFSVGIAANYSAYKGEFKKSTPGGHIRAGYSVNEKITANLGFTYGMPIKQQSAVTVTDDDGNSILVDSDIKYNFKTISLLGNYRFIGDEETSGSFYGQFGASFVLVNYKEDITGSYDKNVYKYPQDLVEKTNESGFTLNFGLGGEYRIGTPVIFGEAGLALPANQVNNSYVENVIPAHFTFSLGIKIPLGSGGDY